MALFPPAACFSTYIYTRPRLCTRDVTANQEVHLTLEGSSCQQSSIMSATMHSARSESDEKDGRKLPREMPVIIAGPSKFSYGIRPVHNSKSKIPNEYTSTDSFHTILILPV